MEPYNNDKNNVSQEGVVLQEKNSGNNTLWYVIVAILLLAVLGWLGYSQGWFGSAPSADDRIPVEQDNGIGDGALPLNIPSIDQTSIESSEGFPASHTLVVNGTLANDCVYLNNSEQTRDGNVFNVLLTTRIEDSGSCGTEPIAFEERIVLETIGLPAGVYVVDINGQELAFELETDNQLDFQAGSDK
ncbi:hypothetical protein CL684_00975 [Candidatus Campbellbacteria bacterium]|nr:hypothetical protein [Candidatus Campbellbacteria bacterium]|tara:strand:- start:616 stop:1179 length:564 start_codon:yes stop_codon:yes gene_type:complete